MKELELIAAEAQKARTEGKSAALATVVSIEGSAYRLPGARMLIVDGRWTAGSISGGCLEDDVVLRAGEAIERGAPVVTTYDTTSDDDIVFGVGLGCKGVITIFIEPVGPVRADADYIEFVRACLSQRAAATVATVVRTTDPGRAAAGARLMQRDGEVTTDIADEAVVAAIKGRIELGADERGQLIALALGTTELDVFIERIAPPTPLVVFGAGHDAAPVVRLAKAIGWHVTLVDHRPAYANAARFPEADRIVLCQPAEVAETIPLQFDTLALVMTHNYLRDRDLLGVLLPSAARYVGLLGPRKRTDQLLSELRDAGAQVSSDEFGRLYAPVGLDIGSEGPAEVALSIVSEMQAVITHHGAGHLRERKQPIHEPAGAAVTA
jgi:xanthine/CO dehydrogenase XdhC/CoxF family maturation factor